MDHTNAAAILTRQLLRDPTPAVVRALADAVVGLDSPEAVAGVMDALQGMTEQGGIDTVCRVWAATRHPELGGLLARAGWVASNPADLRLLTALQSGRLEVATDAGPEVVALLLAAAQDADPIIAGRAEQALRGLNQPAAQDEVCRLVVEEDHPAARSVAVEAGYAPRDPERRALFYLLTEQWAAYERLDFDASLLRTIYEVGDEALRKRIADYARRAGRVEFVEVVAGGRLHRRLAEMTRAEWEVVLALLVRSHGWQLMWQLAQVAPPVWGVCLLRQLRAPVRVLRQAAWAPAQAEEAAGLAELAELAARCSEAPPPLGGLLSCRAVLEGHTGRILCLAVSPTPLDGGTGAHLLASGSRDGTLRLWQLPDGTQVKTQKTYADAVEQLSISPDGRWLVSGSACWASDAPDHVAVQVWQLPDGSVLKTLKGCGPDFAMGSAAWPDGPAGVLTCASSDGSPRVWQLPVAKAMKRLRGHAGEVARLAISPTPLDQATGQLLLVTGSDDRTLRLWSLPDGKALKTLIGHTGAIWCLAISPDGRLLASGSHDHTVRVWSLPAGEPVGTLKGHSHGVTHLAFSPAPPGAAGTAQLLVSASTDNSIRLWQLPEGTALKTMEGRGPIAISPDGSLLVSGHSDGGVWLWQLPDGLPLKRLDMRNGTPDALFGGGQQATCLAFGHNRPLDGSGGQWLVAGSGDGKIWAWASDLVDLCERPLVQARLEDLKWAEDARQAKAVTDAERRWLDLVLSMMRWRWRFDIHLEEAPRRIAVGEFDIEIDE